jgi:hypothetical protein
MGSPRRLVLLLLLLVVSFPVCWASIAVVPTAEELFNQSDLVVLGEVIGIESRSGGVWGIYTAVSLRVETVYKGVLTSSLIEFNIPGGTIGPFGVLVEDQPTFKVGERALLFLTRNSPLLGELSIYELTTGTSMGRSFVNGNYTYGPLGDRYLLPDGRKVDGYIAIQLFSELELLILASAFIASFALISIPRGKSRDPA